MSDKRNMDIGELYRSSFKSFEAAPSQGGFTALSEKLRLKRRRLRRNRLAAGSGAVVLVAALTIAFWPTQNEPVAEAQLPHTATELSNTVTTSPQQSKNEAVSNEISTAPAAQLNEEAENPVQPETELADGTEPAGSQATDVQPRVNSNPGSNLASESNNTTTEFTTPGSLKTGEEDESTEKADVYIFVSSDTLICLGQSVILEAEGAVSYEWSNGSTTPFIKVSPEMTSVYRLTVVDQNNTIQVFDITVSVKDCADLIMPNAFTPNYDNQNDVFKPVGNEVNNFRMQIFARNGQMVFETTDFYRGWNGEVDGQIAAPGAFIYVVSYTNRLGEPIVKRGSVTLLP